MYSFETVLLMEYKQLSYVFVLKFLMFDAFVVSHHFTQTSDKVFRCFESCSFPKHQADTHRLLATGVLIMLCHVDVQSFFSFLFFFH